MTEPLPSCDVRVRDFRQVLLWPLRVRAESHRPWHALRALGEATPWREWFDEYTGDPARFHERHYHEFVAFLPYVQRFLYGEGRAGRAADDELGGPPMRVFRRRDVAAARVCTRTGSEPLVLRVVHVDLYFFFDVDVVLLNVEFQSGELTLMQAQELLYRFGRAYPPGWDDAGDPLHCASAAEWLDANGRVLARSDAHDRHAFLAHVAEHRAPRIAAHWAWILEPLVAEHSGREGPMHYRQIEYHRMPMMAYLALDDPCALSRSDMVRLGLVTGAGDGGLPYSEQHLANFEARHCYDRFWTAQGVAPYTRYLCCGHAIVVLGRADSAFFRDSERGVLAQFRHDHFLLFLIAHFQKAALLMFSDRLVEALKRLDVRDAASVKRFKRAIRTSHESFLRFTHRYWFHEVSEQVQTRALFHLTASHLGLDPLYAEVKERTADMNAYLEADSLRRQANTVVRLTVVTIFGLIGTVTTGLLGMNLLDEAEAPLATRLTWLAMAFCLAALLTIYTLVKSKRLSDFLDALSDQRLSGLQKVRAFAAVWRRGPD